jgi:hypothetical protein
MTASSEFYSVIRRVVRVAPTFAIMALVGCVIAKVARVPVNQIGVAVSAPLVILFVINRIFIVSLPEPDGLRSSHGHADKRSTVVGKTSLVVTLLVAMTLLLAFVFALSAGIYASLGLSVLSHRTLRLVEALMVGTAGGVLFVVLLRISRDLVRETCKIVVIVIWQAVYLPTRLAETFFRSHSGQTHY